MEIESPHNEVQNQHYSTASAPSGLASFGRISTPVRNSTWYNTDLLWQAIRAIVWKRDVAAQFKELGNCDTNSPKD